MLNLNAKSQTDKTGCEVTDLPPHSDEDDDGDDGDDHQR